MLILKRGKTNCYYDVKCYKCYRCGCVFTATDKEYRYDHNGESYASCPCCGSECDDQIFDWEDYDNA